MKSFFISIIKLYQKYLSPLKRTPTCKYIPCCSQYSIDAIREHGAFVGLFLTIKRLLKCNPWSSGGYDPVPPRHRFKKSGKD